ncbi:hypothetical protein [Streptomyces sp. NRRL B-1347]|uniref:hypothetical protein n=1 Tax=Streptomyces sp. NRRL B-1347 TaxID=1476877 RepID=UPI000A40806E|nr:hypothetical protein [Streptomyces sp. NRRL B-1347]
MSDDGFFGPPWQMDWTLKAQAARDALPEHVRKLVDAARAELVTAKDPYFRGVEADAGLPDTIRVEGPRVLYFDNYRGWLRYVFMHRVDDPQIVVEEIFWQ